VSPRTRRPHRPLTHLLGERGAAAVEFALVAPVLVVLLFGIVEYSKVFSAQSALSAAAREGVRVVALNGTTADGQSVARTAASSLSLGASAFAWSRTSCSGAAPTATVTLTVSYRQVFTFGGLGRTGVDLIGRASMRCGG
jgi:Flp pilus assembly protein TadG